jgi:hypothetical protein
VTGTKNQKNRGTLEGLQSKFSTAYVCVHLELDSSVLRCQIRYHLLNTIEH